ncbi:MAG: hypothetical protein JXQ89_21560 [Pelagimonas sp.]
MSNELKFQLAIAIADKLRGFGQNANSIKVDGLDYNWHGGESAHENCWAILWQIEIVLAAAHYQPIEWSERYHRKEISRQEYEALLKTRPMIGNLSVEKHNANSKYYGVVEGFPAYFHIRDAASCSKVLRQRQEVDWPEVDLLLSTYINIDANYGKPLLPAPKGRAFMVSHARHTRVMRALSKEGFASTSGEEYAWTSRVEPIMQKLFIWE